MRIDLAPFSLVSSWVFRTWLLEHGTIMLRLPKDRTRFRTDRTLPSCRFGVERMGSLWILLLAGTAMLSACGGGSSSGGGPQIPLSLTGNWQFTVAPPA